MFPVEARCTDIHGLREEFGHRALLMGGVDNMALIADGKAVDEELRRLTPLLEEGGYTHGGPQMPAVGLLRNLPAVPREEAKVDRKGRRLERGAVVEGIIAACRVFIVGGLRFWLNGPLPSVLDWSPSCPTSRQELGMG